MILAYIFFKFVLKYYNFRYQSIRRTISQESETNSISRTDTLCLDSSKTKFREHGSIALQFISKKEFPTLLQQNQV